MSKELKWLWIYDPSALSWDDLILSQVQACLTWKQVNEQIEGLIKQVFFTIKVHVAVEIFYFLICAYQGSK